MTVANAQTTPTKTDPSDEAQDLDLGAAVVLALGAPEGARSAALALSMSLFGLRVFFDPLVPPGEAQFRDQNDAVVLIAKNLL